MFRCAVDLVFIKFALISSRHRVRFSPNGICLVLLDSFCHYSVLQDTHVLSLFTYENVTSFVTFFFLGLVAITRLFLH